MNNKTKQYNYDQETDEFIYNPTGNESGDLTGNRVFVSWEPGIPGEFEIPRYKVEIDDFGCVLAAFNRLVQKIQPTFIFPEK